MFLNIDLLPLFFMRFNQMIFFFFGGGAKNALIFFSLKLYI